MFRSPSRRVLVLVALVVAASVPLLRAASKAVNLDGKVANGSESTVSLDILSSYPAKVQNKITNRAVGDVYTFRWPSAGPGGFTSQLGAGTAAGVGVQWVWQTTQAIYSFTGTGCSNDICFSYVSGPDAGQPTNNPAWRVPGRTVTPGAAAVSSASLTASLITFFSPPQVLVEVTSSVAPLASGQLAYSTTYTNTTNQQVTIEVVSPADCCPAENQLNCDGTCVDFLDDPQNCGGCGVECSEGEICEYGWCQPPELECPGGETLCNGTYCADLNTDVDNCGYCGYSCANQTFGFIEGCESYECNSGNCYCAGGYLTSRPVVKSPVAPARLEGPIGSPVCQTTTLVLLPGGTSTQCEVSQYFPKEVATVLSVCGDAIPDGESNCGGTDPASSGTFMKFEPDLTQPYPAPGVLITPVTVTVQETVGNGDGVLQPGETANVFIAVLNAGTESLMSPNATLSSPPVDLTNDEVVNEASISISQPYSLYPDLPGVAPNGSSDCSGAPSGNTPQTNLTAFVVSIPADHPEDVVRPFMLDFAQPGLAPNGNPPVMVVFNFGIASLSADLSVTAEDQPDPVPAGGEVTYRIAVRNDGPGSATGISLKSDVPAETTLASIVADPGWSCAVATLAVGDTVNCTYNSSLGVGQSSSVQVIARVDACTTAAELRNEIRVESIADENAANNQVTVVTAVADSTPVVDLVQPNSDQTGLPNVNYPVTVRWTTSGPSPVVDEKVYLDSCLLWDGDVYGDRDGLLRDEYQLRTTKYLLCQAMARCGLTVLYNPRLRVVAEDTCGRRGEDSVIYRKRLLKTEVCGR